MGTSMSIQRTAGESGGGSGGASGLQQLIEKNVVVSIAGNENKYIPIDVGFDRYEIRTISVVNDAANNSVASIFDKSTGGTKVYQSLQELYTYDIINVPCEDKGATKTCHLYIENKGGSTGTFTIIIKFTNLL